MDLTPYLFDDEKMRDFLVHGYCVLQVDFPQSFHEGIYEKTRALLERDGNPGNNVLPRIPEVQKVFDHPAVRGALVSLLGPSYIMHVHRFPHVNGPGSEGGGWHKDSYWGYRKVRDHHPRWVMAMYYPQDVPLERGPTGTIPGSQYFESRVPALPTGEALDPEGIGLPAVGAAGTVILIHFDLWHRAFPNRSDQTRFMFKFQFTRMEEPVRACWNRTGDEIPLNGLSGHPRSPLWRQMWRWLCADPTWETAGDPSALAAALRDDSEEIRLSAAYTLGGLGAAGRDALREGLYDARADVQREAGYGLATAGPEALPDLIQALQAQNERTRGYAVYALGDRGAHAGDAVPALAALADDPSEFVRRNLADALGQIRRQAPMAVPALIHLLEDADAQTRFNAAYGLARLGSEAAAAAPALAEALADDNRYVRGHAAIALERIGTPEALRLLLHHLQATRWCPITTRESAF